MLAHELLMLWKKLVYHVMTYFKRHLTSLDEPMYMPVAQAVSKPDHYISKTTERL